MDEKYILQEYYENYLKNVRKVKDVTVKKYTSGLQKNIELINEKNLWRNPINSIYEIGDMQSLIDIRDILINDVDFKEKDERGNRMYSVALKNYIRFAEGNDFLNKAGCYKQIDIPVEASLVKEASIFTYNRSSIIKDQAIKVAGYMCECDNGHSTFTARRTQMQYMEGHHLIPMKMQKEFRYSLDSYANIVSVCPICHRLLHYGVEKEKRGVLEELYQNRIGRLHQSGIDISKSDFLDLTL